MPNKEDGAYDYFNLSLLHFSLNYQSHQHIYLQNIFLWKKGDLEKYISPYLKKPRWSEEVGEPILPVFPVPFPIRLKFSIWVVAKSEENARSL